MAYADLADVQRAPTADVLRLLRLGEPQERVWAAWTLGLRDQGGAWLVERARLDPTPGVRRHLAVMMAGFGRRDDLWRVAEDPHLRVRATALHWLCRLSRPSDVVAWDRLMPRLDWEPPAVRAAILRGLPEQLPPDVDTRWPAALDDPYAEVRSAALDRLAGRPEDRQRLTLRLMHRLGEETDRELRQRVHQLLDVPVRPRRTRGTRYPLARLDS